MWGQETVSQIGKTKVRIIPTRVGTRQNYQPVFTKGRDHPHACGDKAQKCGQGLPRKGSSPRVWGQGNNSNRQLAGQRIIPTRVGTSINTDYIFTDNTDHPHACGDKFCRSFMSKPRVGSSPRVWGQAARNREIIKHLGIIPTRVGTRSEFS